MRDYSFGNFLCELRERRGLSQYQLGMLVGVSPQAVSKWENGTAKPKSGTLFQLGEMLGVTVDELLSCQYHPTERSVGKGVFSMKDKLWKQAKQALHDRYGAMPSPRILNRYLSEAAELQESDVIIYLALAAKLVEAAREQHEAVRINGVSASSFIAFLLGATEINPLEPHWFCPACGRTVFSSGISCGWDLPAECCLCGEAMQRDGHDLPFEALRQMYHSHTMADISVSPDFYSRAKCMIADYFTGNQVVILTRDHSPVETMVVIGDALSDYTDGQTYPFAEHSERLRQYPRLTLVQNEALSFPGRLFAATAVKPNADDFLAPEILDAFCAGNTAGIPEFGSDFVRGMLAETKPTCFDDLIRLCGLAHGTGVWFDNAQTLLHQGIPLGQVIAYREDVFHAVKSLLLRQGIANTGLAYQIMRDVGRGRFALGEGENEQKQLAALGAEAWLIESMTKIRYLFPRAHGAGYVRHALVLMWYKLHFPREFAAVMT